MYILLDQLAVPERAMDRAFRLPVVDVFKGGIRGSGGVSVSGRIESGNVQVGDEVMIMPSKEVGLVKGKYGNV
jgi:elongation factor 1 alpha-like protein